MDVWTDREAFQQKNKEIGQGIYHTVYTIAKDSREVAEQYNNHLLEYEALLLSFRGILPDRFNPDVIPKLPDCIVNLCKELCSVDDISIRTAVFKSCISSIRKRYLVFNYKGVKRNKHNRARIRVLSRIMWDKYLRNEVDARRY